MTRIIAGQLRSLRLQVPARGTRPTTDRVREALFSAIEARLDLRGIAVADLCAGSGALGIEALSRGAASCDFVESAAAAARVLDANARTAQQRLGLPGMAVRVHRAALPGWIAGTPPRSGGFDLVLCDPPYAAGDIVAETLSRLVESGWLSDIAFVAVERSARTAPVDFPQELEVVLSRKYGETRMDLAEYRPGARR